MLTGTPVTEIGADVLRLRRQRIAARTILWAAGVAASPLGASCSGAELDRAGRVRVQPDLSLPGHPEVFVAGDLASMQQDGKPVPGVAPAAKQMGAHVADNILRAHRGRATTAVPLHGTSATWPPSAAFGRRATAGLRFSGILAWWFWLVAAHLSS